MLTKIKKGCNPTMRAKKIYLGKKQKKGYGKSKKLKKGNILLF